MSWPAQLWLYRCLAGMHAFASSNQTPPPMCLARRTKLHFVFAVPLSSVACVTLLSPDSLCRLQELQEQGQQQVQT